MTISLTGAVLDDADNEDGGRRDPSSVTLGYHGTVFHVIPDEADRAVLSEIFGRYLNAELSVSVDPDAVVA